MTALQAAIYLNPRFFIETKPTKMERENSTSKSPSLANNIQTPSSLLLGCPNDRMPRVFQQLLLQISQFLDKNNNKTETQLQKAKEKLKPPIQTKKTLQHTKQTQKPQILQQQKTQQEKKHKKPMIRTSTISPSLKSHNYQIIPPKRIKTPDWIMNDEEDAISDESEHEKKVKNADDFDFVEEHKKIELFENRIIYGIDGCYYHPAQARELALDTVGVVMSKEEYQKSQRYDCQTLPEKKPLFWPERVWDTSDSTMTQEENDKLKNAIDEINILPKSFPVQPSLRSSSQQSTKRSHSSSSLKRITPRNPSIVCINFGLFDTDDEDGTDLSD